MDRKKDKNMQKEWEKDWEKDWDNGWDNGKEYDDECNCRIKIEKSKVFIICDDDFDVNSLETLIEVEE